METDTTPRPGEEPSQPLETARLSFKESPIHGMGGFARLPIPKDARIIEYVGEKIDKQESLRRCEANNEYIFSLGAEHDLDGNFKWNPARLLNHSCTPNCEAELDDGRIWIVALRDIEAGEEITFNYGFDLADYREYRCNCGSPECVGFIIAEEFFPQLRSRY
jgi:SET domain-containing protein